MEGRFYTCEYCFKEYEPKRRRIQIYCSNTCRSKAYHARKNSSKNLIVVDKQENSIEATILPPPPSKTKIEAVSFPGITNSTFGSLAADGIKSLLTPEEKKPATKADIKNLSDKIINRYHLVKNRQARADGAFPYFDLDTGHIVYFILPR